MEFIKQLKCAGGNRNCILQNAECILLQGFLPDLKTYLKTEKKFDVTKLPLAKAACKSTHGNSQGRVSSGTVWEGGPWGHAFPLYPTETQEDFSSRGNPAGQEKQYRQPPFSLISGRGGSTEIIPLLLNSSSLS